MSNILASGLSWIDLQFQGRLHTIATAVVHGGGQVGLVDPGPATCVQALDLGLQAQGLRLSDVTHIVLTHIHLDHAGATGTIVRQLPHVRVFVHERGAPHVADPSKLLASASRLYGADMERLWGDVLPVPQDRLGVLKGGERIEVGGRTFEVAYTPGHASHHVSYFDPSSGVAFVGDTAGVCVDGGYVLPATPPPDVDIEAWQGSRERIEAWGPRTIFLTHFGPAHDPTSHMRALFDNLARTSALVRKSLDGPGSDAEKAEQFAVDLARELRQQMPEPRVAAYLLAAPPDQLWLGLARYWRKKSV